jgi:hypothetical protein
MSSYTSNFFDIMDIHLLLDPYAANMGTSSRSAINELNNVVDVIYDENIKSRITKILEDSKEIPGKIEYSGINENNITLQKYDDIVHSIVNNIVLPPLLTNKSILLAAGYLPHIGSGHMIALYILEQSEKSSLEDEDKKEAKDKLYTIVFVNTGDGVDYHGPVQNGICRGIIVKTNCTLDTVKLVIKHSVIMKHNKKVSAINANIELFYYGLYKIFNKEEVSIDTYVKTPQSEIDTALKNIPIIRDAKYHEIPMQFAGSCVSNSLYYFIYYIFMSSGKSNDFYYWFYTIKLFRTIQILAKLTLHREFSDFCQLTLLFDNIVNNLRRDIKVLKFINTDDDERKKLIELYTRSMDQKDDQAYKIGESASDDLFKTIEEILTPSSRYQPEKKFKNYHERVFETLLKYQDKNVMKPNESPYFKEMQMVYFTVYIKTCEKQLTKLQNLLSNVLTYPAQIFDADYDYDISTIKIGNAEQQIKDGQILNKLFTIDVDTKTVMNVIDDIRHVLHKRIGRNSWSPNQNELNNNYIIFVKLALFVKSLSSKQLEFDDETLSVFLCRCMDLYHQGVYLYHQQPIKIYYDRVSPSDRSQQYGINYNDTSDTGILFQFNLLFFKLVCAYTIKRIQDVKIEDVPIRMHIRDANSNQQYSFDKLIRSCKNIFDRPYMLLNEDDMLKIRDLLASVCVLLPNSILFMKPGSYNKYPYTFVSYNNINESLWYKLIDALFPDTYYPEIDTVNFEPNGYFSSADIDKNINIYGFKKKFDERKSVNQHTNFLLHGKTYLSVLFLSISILFGSKPLSIDTTNLYDIRVNGNDVDIGDDEYRFIKRSDDYIKQINDAYQNNDLLLFEYNKNILSFSGYDRFDVLCNIISTKSFDAINKYKYSWDQNILKSLAHNIASPLVNPDYPIMIENTYVSQLPDTNILDYKINKMSELKLTSDELNSIRTDFLMTYLVLRCVLTTNINEDKQILYLTRIIDERCRDESTNTFKYYNIVNSIIKLMINYTIPDHILVCNKTNKYYDIVDAKPYTYAVISYLYTKLFLKSNVQIFNDNMFDSKLKGVTNVINYDGDNKNILAEGKINDIQVYIYHKSVIRTTDLNYDFLMKNNTIYGDKSKENVQYHVRVNDNTYIINKLESEYGTHCNISNDDWKCVHRGYSGIIKYTIDKLKTVCGITFWERKNEFKCELDNGITLMFDTDNKSLMYKNYQVIDIAPSYIKQYEYCMRNTILLKDVNDNYYVLIMKWNESYESTLKESYWDRADHESYKLYLPFKNNYYILPIHPYGLSIYDNTKNVKITNDAMQAYLTSCIMFSNHYVLDLILEQCLIRGSQLPTYIDDKNNVVDYIINNPYKYYFLTRCITAIDEKKYDKYNNDYVSRLLHYPAKYKLQTEPIAESKFQPEFKIDISNKSPETIINELKNLTADETKTLEENLNNLHIIYLYFMTQSHLFLHEIILDECKTYYQAIYLNNIRDVLKNITPDSPKEHIEELNNLLSPKILYNEPRKNYEILFELLFSKFIRADQKQLANQIILDINESKEKQFFQFLMGKGKTSVITPLITLYYFYESQEMDIKQCLVAMPSQLLNQSRNIFCNYGFLLKNITFNVCNINRNDDTKCILTNPIDKRLVLIDDTSLKTFLLNQKETKHDDYDVTLQNTVMIMDEIDTLINPLESELNYPHEKIKLLNSDILCSILVNLFINGDVHEIKYDKKSFDILLKNTKQLFVDYKDDNQIMKLWNNVIDNKYDDIKNIKLAAGYKKLIEILPSCTSLIYNKNYGFGSYDNTNEKNDKIAIPYSSVNTPINGSQFTDPYMTLVLTVLSCKYNGLNNNQIVDTIQKYYNYVFSVNKKMKQHYFDTVFNKTPKVKDMLANGVLHDVVLPENEYNILRYDVQLIKDYLNCVVVSEYVDQTNQQLNCSFYDIITASFCEKRTGFSGTTNIIFPNFIARRIKTIKKRKSKQKKIIKSDPDTADYYETDIEESCLEKYKDITSLPLYKHKNEFISFARDSYATDQVRNAIISGKVIIKSERKSERKKDKVIIKSEHEEDKVIIESEREEDKVIIEPEKKKDAKLSLCKKILDVKTCSMLKSYDALIDCAALFRNYSSEIVAKELQIILKKKVVYWDIDDNEHIIGDNDDVFIYYDQKHTVGIDYPQKVHMRGLVTVTNFNRLTDISQGMFRLRKLNKGHSVDFYINNLKINSSEQLYERLVQNEINYRENIRYKAYIQILKVNYRQEQKFIPESYTENVFDEIKEMTDLKQTIDTLYLQFLDASYCSKTDIEINKYLCRLICHYYLLHLRKSGRISMESVRQFVTQLNVFAEVTEEKQITPKKQSVNYDRDLIIRSYFLKTNRMVNIFASPDRYEYDHHKIVVSFLEQFKLYVSPLWFNVIAQMVNYINKSNDYDLAGCMFIKYPEVKNESDKELLITQQEYYVLHKAFLEMKFKISNGFNLDNPLKSLLTFRLNTYESAFKLLIMCDDTIVDIKEIKSFIHALETIYNSRVKYHDLFMMYIANQQNWIQKLLSYPDYMDVAKLLEFHTLPNSVIHHELKNVYLHLCNLAKKHSIDIKEIYVCN